MGNSIMGFSSHQNIGIELALQMLHNDFEFKEELKGSRIFKVAKVIGKDDKLQRWLVAKMFVNSDNAFKLSEYKQLIEPYCNRIKNGFNIIPYYINSVDRSSASLIRDFVEQSLLDRLSTRPFLCLEEKLWISYQILKSLEQLHSIVTDSCYDNRYYCHGDIKAENVLITSWSWVLLADPAPFKPTYLPSNNPTLFTHLFDTSRRRACYLAPERFIDTSANSFPDPYSPSLETATDVVKEINETEPDTDDESAKMQNDTDNDNINENMLKYQQSSEIGLRASPNNYNEDHYQSPSLKPSMDLFSAGCVILELLTDGSMAFTLSDLLAYRNGDEQRINNLVDQICNEDMKTLILTLLNRNEAARKSANEILREQNGHAFPSLFYGPFLAFMQSYLLEERQSPSVRLASLKISLNELLSYYRLDEERRIVAILCTRLVTSSLRPMPINGRASHTPYTSANPMEDPIPQMKSGDSDTNQLTDSAKFDGILCLLLLAEHLSPSHTADHVIPYLVDVCLSSMKSSEICCSALDALAQVLEGCRLKMVECAIDRECGVNLTLLSEYLMHNLNILSVHEECSVRVCFTKLIPVIVDLALVIFNQTEAITVSDTTQIVFDESRVADPQKNISELIVLRKSICECLVTMFTDSSNLVRLSLIETGCMCRIAELLGQTWTSDVLMSHMITFLNDKHAPELRAAFYDQIGPLVSLTSVQSISLLRPLLDQGLVDANVQVIESCLRLLTRLLKREVLCSATAVELLDRVLPLVVHPAARIRHAAISFIVLLSHSTYQSEVIMNEEKKQLNSQNPVQLGLFKGKCGSASVYARIAGKSAKVFFKRPILLSCPSEYFFLSNLRKPLSKSYVEMLLTNCLLNRDATASGNAKSASVLQLFDAFIDYLKEPFESKCVSKEDQLLELIKKMHYSQLTKMNRRKLVCFAPLLRGLLMDGLNGEYNGQYFEFGARAKRLQGTNSAFIFRMIETFLKTRLISLDMKLSRKPSFYGDTSIIEHLQFWLSDRLSNGKVSLPSNQYLKNILTTRSVEFFGRLFTITKSSSSFNQLSNSMGYYSDTANLSGTAKMSELDSNDVGSLRNEGLQNSSYQKFGSVKSTLVAHLHEHKAGFLSLRTHPLGEIVASCSSGDGMLKLWNTRTSNSVNKREYTSEDHSSYHSNENIISERDLHFEIPVRSSATFNCAKETRLNTSNASCRGLVWCDKGYTVATIFNGREIHLYDVSTSQSRGVQSLEHSKYGLASCLCSPHVTSFEYKLNRKTDVFDWENSTNWNMLFWATSSGDIIGRDLRMASRSPVAFNLKQSIKHNLITSLACHSAQSWLVSGTTHGHLVSWDLRYRRPVAWTSHPANSMQGVTNLRIYDVPSSSSMWPQSNGQVLVLSAHQKQNEISIWDLEACACMEASNESSNRPGVSMRTSCFAASEGGSRLAAAWSSSDATAAESSFKSPTLIADQDSLGSNGAVYSMLCLPPDRESFSPSSNLSHPKHNLPILITGGIDARIRRWNLTSPSNSSVMIWAGWEEITPPMLSYKRVLANGMNGVAEELVPIEAPFVDEPKSLLTACSPIATGQSTGHQELLSPKRSMPSQKSGIFRRKSDVLKPKLPPTYQKSGKLRMRQATQGHVNGISDLGFVWAGEPLLVSASMDGVIKFWK